MMKIVLDPGHGGHQAAGKSSPYGTRLAGGGYEKELTLEVCRRLAGRAPGRVALTRSDDRNVSLSGRLDVLRSSAADVFLSVHAHDSNHGRGAQVWVHPRCDQASDRLAHSVAQQLGYGTQVRQAELAVLTPERVGASAACMVELDTAELSAGPGVLERWSAELAQGLGAYSHAGQSWNGSSPGWSYGAMLDSKAAKAAHGTRFGEAMLTFAEQMPGFYGDWLKRLDPYQRLDLAEVFLNPPTYLKDSWFSFEHVLRERRNWLINLLPNTWHMYRNEQKKDASAFSISQMTDGILNKEPKSKEEIQTMGRELDKFLDPTQQAKTTVGELLHRLATDEFMTGICGETARLLTTVALKSLIEPVIADDKVKSSDNPENNLKTAAIVQELLGKYGKTHVVGFRFELRPHAFLFVCDRGRCAPFSSYFGKCGMGGGLRLYTPINDLDDFLEEWPGMWTSQSQGRKYFGYGPEFKTEKLNIHDVFVAKDWDVTKTFTKHWMDASKTKPQAWNEVLPVTMTKLGIANVLG